MKRSVGLSAKELGIHYALHYNTGVVDKMNIIATKELIDEEQLKISHQPVYHFALVADEDLRISASAFRISGLSISVSLAFSARSCSVFRCENAVRFISDRSRFLIHLQEKCSDLLF